MGRVVAAGQRLAQRYGTFCHKTEENKMFKKVQLKEAVY
jgi:hypothetical protein